MRGKGGTMAPETNGGNKNHAIIRCSCLHDHQDNTYGRGMRVHSRCFKDGQNWRCTVCKSTR